MRCMNNTLKIWLTDLFRVMAYPEEVHGSYCVMCYSSAQDFRHWSVSWNLWTGHNNTACCLLALILAKEWIMIDCSWCHKLGTNPPNLVCEVFWAVQLFVQWQTSKGRNVQIFLFLNFVLYFDFRAMEEWIYCYVEHLITCIAVELKIRCRQRIFFRCAWPVFLTHQLKFWNLHR